MTAWENCSDPGSRGMGVPKKMRTRTVGLRCYCTFTICNMSSANLPTSQFAVDSKVYSKLTTFSNSLENRFFSSCTASQLTAWHYFTGIRKETEPLNSSLFQLLFGGTARSCVSYWKYVLIHCYFWFNSSLRWSWILRCMQAGAYLLFQMLNPTVIIFSKLSL